MTTPTEPATLKAEAEALWERGLAEHSNGDDIRGRDVVRELLWPAIDAWLAARPGPEQTLAAMRVGWEYGWSRNVPLGVALAAADIHEGLSQVREQRDPQMRDAVFRRAARDMGLDPDDLPLQSLFDALGITGPTFPTKGHERDLDDLITVIDIAADVLTNGTDAPAIVWLARHDPGLPRQLGQDAVGVVREALREVEQVIGAAAVGWQAGLATAEDVGTVYAVHHIAMLAEQDPDLRMGARTPAQWAHGLSESASDRLHHRLGHDAARRIIATAEREARRTETTTPPQNTPDHGAVNWAGAAFPRLTSAPPTTAAPDGPKPTEPNVPRSQQHRAR